jgi:hypothetical protein
MERARGNSRNPNVRFWPKADISFCIANVRFRGGKADTVDRRPESAKSMDFAAPSVFAKIWKTLILGRVPEKQVNRASLVRSLDSPGIKVWEKFFNERDYGTFRIFENLPCT